MTLRQDRDAASDLYSALSEVSDGAHDLLDATEHIDVITHMSIITAVIDNAISRLRGLVAILEEPEGQRNAKTSND